MVGTDIQLTDLPGVGKVTAKKLEDAGLYNVEQLTTSPVLDLQEITGMDAAAIMKLINKARKALVDSGRIARAFRTADEVEKDQVRLIDTGTECFNSLLGGGLETKALTEVYGEYGSGKTQFCYTMACRVQLPPEEGGLDGDVVWIDTENTFNASRIRQIASAMGLDPLEALKRIKVADATNSGMLHLITEELAQDLGNTRLIVIDSAIGPFRMEYIGMGALGRRQDKIKKFVRLLSGIALNHDLSVIITNQVMKDPGVMFGDPTKPVGGMALAHASTYRIYFKKLGKKRHAIMVDSPKHPQTEVEFLLTEEGIKDVEK